MKIVAVCAAVVALGLFGCAVDASDPVPADSLSTIDSDRDPGKTPNSTLSGTEPVVHTPGFDDNKILGERSPLDPSPNAPTAPRPRNLPTPPDPGPVNPAPGR